MKEEYDLNDVQFIEAARKLAEEIHAIEDQDERLDEAELEYLNTNNDDAKAFLAIGSSPAKDGVLAAELAALTTVCQAILNLDSTVTKG